MVQLNPPFPPPSGNHQWLHSLPRSEGQRICLGDVADCANLVGFQGLVPLLPHFCQLSVLEVGVCGVYSESP